MGGVIFRFLLRLSSLFLIVGCISLPRSFHVLRYKNQTVYLDEHYYYRVGPLSEAWTTVPQKGAGIVFRNQKNRATLTTNALCGAEFEDLPLEQLTDHLFAGLSDVRILKRELWPLSERKGLYTEAQASLDGVSVWLYLVVLKKNRCQFDFFGVSPLKNEGQVQKDFEAFVKGFHY